MTGTIKVGGTPKVNACCDLYTMEKRIMTVIVRHLELPLTNVQLSHWVMEEKKSSKTNLKREIEFRFGILLEVAVDTSFMCISLS